MRPSYNVEKETSSTCRLWPARLPIDLHARSFESAHSLADRPDNSKMQYGAETHQGYNLSYGKYRNLCTEQKRPARQRHAAILQHPTTFRTIPVILVAAHAAVHVHRLGLLVRIFVRRRRVGLQGVDHRWPSQLQHPLEDIPMF